MSKADGKQIAVKFNLPINTLTLLPVFIPDSTFSVPNGMITASSQYVGLEANKAFDNNLSTYWRPQVLTGMWLMAKLTEARSICGFQVYNGSSYGANGIDLYGSVDGVTFDLIVQTTNANTVGWKTHEFETTTEYQYFKWNITSMHSTRLYLHELTLKFASVIFKSGNEAAFRVSGQEHKYINGPTIDKEYTIDLVQSHPTEPLALLITVDQLARFNNAEGQLKVSYNSALGTLVGVGGAVQSFEACFTPLDILREINPNDEETINAVIGATLEYDIMQYLNASSIEQNTIKANALSATVEYTDVTIVNP